MKDKTGKELFPSMVLLYYPVFGDYKAFMTGGSNHSTSWIRGSINGQHSFTPSEFKTLKTKKLARALYSYEGNEK